MVDRISVFGRVATIAESVPVHNIPCTDHAFSLIRICYTPAKLEQARAEKARRKRQHYSSSSYPTNCLLLDSLPLIHKKDSTRAATIPDLVFPFKR